MSDAELAHDLRVLVRERLMAGDSDEQVLDYVVSRYGEFVLLKPRFSMRNALAVGHAGAAPARRRTARRIRRALAAKGSAGSA